MKKNNYIILIPFVGPLILFIVLLFKLNCNDNLGLFRFIKYAQLMTLFLVIGLITCVLVYEIGLFGNGRIFFFSALSILWLLLIFPAIILSKHTEKLIKEDMLKGYTSDFKRK